MKKEKTYKLELVDTKKYKGEWIAFVKGKIVSHGKVLKDVIEKAKKIGNDPIIDKVPEQDILVL